MPAMVAPRKTSSETRRLGDSLLTTVSLPRNGARLSYQLQPPQPFLNPPPHRLRALHLQSPSEMLSRFLWIAGPGVQLSEGDRQRVVARQGGIAADLLDGPDSRRGPLNPAVALAMGGGPAAGMRGGGGIRGGPRPAGARPPPVTLREAVPRGRGPGRNGVTFP